MLDQPGIGRRHLAQCADATPRRLLSQAPVREDALYLPVVRQHEDTAPLAGDRLLHQESPSRPETPAPTRAPARGPRGPARRAPTPRASPCRPRSNVNCGLEDQRESETLDARIDCDARPRGEAVRHRHPQRCRQLDQAGPCRARARAPPRAARAAAPRPAGVPVREQRVVGTSAVGRMLGESRSPTDCATRSAKPCGSRAGSGWS